MTNYGPCHSRAMAHFGKIQYTTAVKPGWPIVLANKQKELLNIMNLEGEGEIKRLTNWVLIKLTLCTFWHVFKPLIKMLCHRLGTGMLCVVDGRAYTNIQLKPKTGPNQVHVYVEDHIQQSPTKYWQAHCKTVPWTRGTLLFFLFLHSRFCEAVFASNFCQSASGGSWVGSVKDHEWTRGSDNEVCIHTLEPNELMLKNTIFNIQVEGWSPVRWALFLPLRSHFWKKLPLEKSVLDQCQRSD